LFDVRARRCRAVQFSILSFSAKARRYSRQMTLAGTDILALLVAVWIYLVRRRLCLHHVCTGL
jgi:hypothetical protein